MPRDDRAPQAQGGAKGGARGEGRAHESAEKHVTGRAVYLDDIAAPQDLLHAYLGLAPAIGPLRTLDLAAVRAAPGVIATIDARDLAHNDISPTGKGDDPIFPAERTAFHGQPLFAVIAESRDAARRAARLAVIDIAPAPSHLTIAAAEAAGADLVTEPLTLARGDAEAGLAKAPRTLEGAMTIGGQDHFYLEGHIALAIPGEDGAMEVWSSTQHPSEVQHMVAHTLGLPSAMVTVKVRRMGGAFGGKETQSNLFACVAALAARATGRPVKLRPDRDDDMIATGKRHDFEARYRVGYDETGRLHALDMTLAARCGFSADLSGPVTDRALFHVDNCYYYEDVRLRSKPLRTNTVSNTAFRGFGGPQGMLAGERVIEEVAYALGRDPLEIRRANFYREGRDITPYHQRVEDNIITRLVDELEASADYQARRRAIVETNRESPFLRRGIALTPVKFGISFTATWYNQAGALVHIYRDGSVHLNHGGTEMGQGLNTKVAQVLAEALGLPIERIAVTATATDKVPNTSATAASSGADLNAMAALDAAETLKARLLAFAAEKYGGASEDGQVAFENGAISAPGGSVPWTTVVEDAYMARVQLSATGFYKTPEIHWDRVAGRGQPFYYFAYGAACSEVTIDTLTGEYVIDRVDILHDVGRSLNPAIDRGQIEGGFIQGLGWLTTEELVWDEEGRLRTHAPSTYKIPLASDLPRDFRVRIAEWSENAKRTIKRSKAVGEPPFMLAISTLEALSMAVASVADYRVCPRLDTPATPERVLMAVERLRAGSERP
ncbi:MAG: xanthine dehydrogenase molybdopterin binding subunit [Pseudomonadota bacterium]